MSRRPVALLLVLATAGCGAKEAAEQRDTFGENVYVRECARCHGDDGRGYPGVSPALEGTRS